MATQERDEFEIEKMMAVSMLVIFQPDPLRKESRRYQSVVRGWRRGEYIMLDRPRVDARSLLMLRESQDCQIRYMIEGRACGFDSRVIDFDTRRHNPYMRVKWPDRLEYTYFRRGERIKSNLQCMIELDAGNAIGGILKDLSQGGCGFELPTPLDKGTTVRVTCELPNGIQIVSLPLLICGVREQGRVHFHGCSFTDDMNTGKDDIGFYVVSRLSAEHGGSGADQPKRVLLLDPMAARASIISRQLGRKGFATTIASSLVDACFRLKSLPHVAVAVSAELEDLPAAHFVRLIRSSGDFDQLPAVIFGTPEGQASPADNGLGNTVYVPSTPTVGPDTANALFKLIA